MASKSGHEAASAQQIEELLDAVDSTLDRLKTLYEQYFLGIQKQAPSYLHSDVERKLRDLTQLNIRNTGLRYRLATLQQKFGSYNSYWRRTLRQIENGTYIRNLAKIGREAARTGSEIPEEILAAMPKRMREQVLRDRDAALAVARRRKQLEEGDGEQAGGDEAAQAAPARRDAKTATGAHVLSDDDGDIDFNALFSAFEDDAPRSVEAAKPQTQTQAVTRPITRPPMLRMPQRKTSPPSSPATEDSQAGPTPTGPATTAPTQALPRAAVTTTTSPTQALPRTPPAGAPPDAPGGGVPLAAIKTRRIPASEAAGNDPAARQPIPRPPVPPPAPSQTSRPIPVIPGAAGRTGPVPVESMSGPFPRAQAAPEPPSAPAPTKTTRPTPQVPRPSTAPLKPPPGMTEADVNALHAKYVKAKQMVGEKVDPGSREKLLRTINQTAPKIMEQYKASSVDFSVVVKDNQVVIKAKPKA